MKWYHWVLAAGAGVAGYYALRAYDKGESVTPAELSPAGFGSAVADFVGAKDWRLLPKRDEHVLEAQRFTVRSAGRPFSARMA